MDEQKLARAMEAFIRRQISDCENKEPDELRRALRDCGDCRKMINDLLGEDNQHICKELDNSMEHAGEQIRNFYYRSGFSDALVFIRDWMRNGEENTNNATEPSKT